MCQHDCTLRLLRMPATLLMGAVVVTPQKSRSPAKASSSPTARTFTLESAPYRTAPCKVMLQPPPHECCCFALPHATRSISMFDLLICLPTALTVDPHCKGNQVRLASAAAPPPGCPPGRLAASPGRPPGRSPGCRCLAAHLAAAAWPPMPGPRCLAPDAWPPLPDHSHQEAAATRLHPLATAAPL